MRNLKVKRNVALEPRNCECCNGNSFETLWINNFVTQTRNHSWHFPITDVVCKSCGFVFVSPSPTKNSLKNYYENSYIPFSRQVLDYDIEKRVKFIKHHLTSGRLCLEIGGNNDSLFKEKLIKVFSKIIEVELNDSVESDFKSLNHFPKNSADIIVHYFVLEHIAKVREFLSECYETLKPNGIMICEVPDIRLYPKNISALILHEHVNHFSLNTLVRIANSIGFRLIDSSTSLCSRSYGFVTAFTKSKSKCNKLHNKLNEYKKNKKYFTKGVQKLKNFQKKLDETFLILRQHDKKGKKSILWGANDRLLQFLSGDKVLPKTAIVVDSNPLKKNFSEKLKVFDPIEAAQHIIDSDLILIFTKLNSRDILNFVKIRFGKSFKKDKIFILDF